LFIIIINGSILLQYLICTEDAELFINIIEYLYHSNKILFYKVWKQLEKPLSKSSTNLYLESFNKMTINIKFLQYIQKYKNVNNQESYISCIEKYIHEKEKQYASNVIIDIVLESKIHKDILKYMLPSYF
jgi:hypothetical protein